MEMGKIQPYLKTQVSRLTKATKIFIIEGLLTVVMGLLCFVLLIDTPALSGRWLEPDEIRFLELRQAARQQQTPTAAEGHKGHFNKDALLAVICDWKMYLLILGSWSNAVPNYAMKFTMPTIVQSMGFTSSTAQLLTIPPYACGAISAFVFSTLSDRFRWRMPFLAVPQCCVVIGFAVLFSKAADIKNNIAVCYFAVCLACIGMYPIFPSVNAWNISKKPWLILLPISPVPKPQ